MRLSLNSFRSLRQNIVSQPWLSLTERPSIIYHIPSMAAWIVFLTILLSGCGSEPPKINPIQSATAFIKGEQLYVNVTLSPIFMVRIKQMLKHGEPLLAAYQFRLVRINPWLPDTLILQNDLLRQMRLRLITQRYELLDKNKNLTHYASNETDAMHFFGNLRFILLYNRIKLLPGVRYQLTTRVLISHEGMSRMFQFLDRWLSLNQPLDFVYRSELPTNDRITAQ